jgi:hypothetical protein
LLFYGIVFLFYYLVNPIILRANTDMHIPCFLYCSVMGGNRYLQSSTCLKTSNMNNKLFITNKTTQPMHATISDKTTGNNVLSCELQPGANEITVTALHTGIYMICLSDHNNDIFYEQRLVKD